MLMVSRKPVLRFAILRSLKKGKEEKVSKSSSLKRLAKAREKIKPA